MAPALRSASRQSVSIAAAPTFRDQARSPGGPPSASKSVSLTSSLAMSDSPSSGASARARVVLPAAGAPETNTKRRRGRSIVREHLSRYVERRPRIQQRRGAPSTLAAGQARRPAAPLAPDGAGTPP